IAPPVATAAGVLLPACSWCSNSRKWRSFVSSEQITVICGGVKPAASNRLTASSVAVTVEKTPARTDLVCFSAKVACVIAVLPFLKGYVAKGVPDESKSRPKLCTRSPTPLEQRRCFYARNYTFIVLA